MINVFTDKFGSTGIDISSDSIANFKALIQRGLNTWDRAPAELKAFGDQLIEGSILQDYQAQEHAKPRSE